MSDAEKSAFKAGYLLACCNLVHLHDEDCLAADVLAEAGLTKADIRTMDLTDFDKRVLKKIRKARRNDPISTARKERPDDRTRAHR